MLREFLITGRSYNFKSIVLTSVHSSNEHLEPRDTIIFFDVEKPKNPRYIMAYDKHKTEIAQMVLGFYFFFYGRFCF
jgi:hypothetical protein